MPENRTILCEISLFALKLRWFNGIIFLVYLLEVQTMFSNLMLTAQADTTGYLIGQFGVIVVMIAILYFFMIRPQRKRDKEVTEMRDSLEVGDEVITRGGIIGRVVNLKEDTVMIETGSDRTKIRVSRWAIDINTTAEKEK